MPVSDSDSDGVSAPGFARDRCYRNRNVHKSLIEKSSFRRGCTGPLMTKAKTAVGRPPALLAVRRNRRPRRALSDEINHVHN
jgi:hypothetical protein